MPCCTPSTPLTRYMARSRRTCHDSGHSRAPCPAFSAGALPFTPNPLSVPQAVPCQHRTVRGRKSAAVRLLTRKPTAAPLLAPGHNIFQ